MRNGCPQVYKVSYTRTLHLKAESGAYSPREGGPAGRRQKRSVLQAGTEWSRRSGVGCGSPAPWVPPNPRRAGMHVANPAAGRCGVARRLRTRRPRRLPQSRLRSRSSPPRNRRARGCRVAGGELASRAWRRQGPEPALQPANALQRTVRICWEEIRLSSSFPP
ncbi:uncharacterized protein LOC121105826 isoform X2 [Ursus maritimus]|uniref:Uncharacterized protein LOC121105826 isoform X2 n=1 Tax=Ursus maritimus TaxID=29073 RepID=A0A8M1GZ11_URSMA|nr:uncharacterized protein LOC121105826 isoform X2 [Ursus maritimus]